MGENELKALRIAADGGIHYDRARYRDKDGKALSFGGWQAIYRLCSAKLILSEGRSITRGPWRITDRGRAYLAAQPEGATKEQMMERLP